MFLGYLKRNVYVAFFVYFVVLFALWAARLFLYTDIPSDYSFQQMPLQAFLLDFLNLSEHNGQWLAIVFTYFNACMIWVLNVRHLFLKSNEHILPLSYIILASAIPESQFLFGAQAAVSLLLLGTHYLFTTYKQRSALGALFMGAFCFSLASLLFSSAAGLLLLLPIALLIVHTFAWRDWVVTLIAVLLPYSYVLLYYWLVGGDAFLFVEMIEEHFPFPPDKPAMPDVPHLIYLIVVGLLVIISLLVGFSRVAGAKVKVSHIYGIFEWMLLFLLAGTIFFPSDKYLTMPLLAVPVSVFVTTYFAMPKGKKVRTAFLIIFVAAILIVQLF